MLDTIEHLKNPSGYLTKIKSILKPKGILVIETGDIGSYLAKFQKSHWRLITPPSHLYYFSKKTLTVLLKNKEFLIKEIVNVSFYRSMSQIIFRLIGKHIFNLPKRILNRPITLNTGDLIFVVAQKPN